MIRKFLIAAAFAVFAPIAASAATITGQIDITGTVDLGASDFSNTGGVVFAGSGTVNAVTLSGGFAGADTSSGAVNLTDISFTAPGLIWEVSGFSFVATSFFDIVDDLNTKGFSALGQILSGGFDPTDGLMTFSTQSNNPSSVLVSFSSTTTPVPLPAGGLMLLTALGGFGAYSARRRKAKAKAVAA